MKSHAHLNEYPDNIISDLQSLSSILQSPSLILSLTDYPIKWDKELLERCINSLTNKFGKEVIYMRYKKHKTLSAISRELGISINRVAQINGSSLRRILRYAEAKKLEIENPDVLYQKYNINTSMERIQVEDILNSNKNFNIYSLNISIRAINRILRGSNVRTFNDLILHIYYGDSLLNIRGLGIKSLKEILTKVSEFGIEIPDHYREYI